MNETEKRFVLNLKDALAIGKNTVSEADVKFAPIFDEAWLDTVEDALHSIENIAKEAKSFIKNSYELVNVEKARKVDSYAIRHLAEHSEYVKEVNLDGSVVPIKIMEKHLEQDYAIYENRVVYTLIGKLIYFVSQRQTKLSDITKSKDKYIFAVDSSFPYDNSEVTCKLEFNIDRPSGDERQRVQLHDITERVDNILLRLNSLRSSNFCKALSNTKPVVPPINRTNIFAKSPDYSKCYELWKFISGIDEETVSIEAVENHLPIDEERIKEITRIVASNVFDIVARREAYDALVTTGDFYVKKFKYNFVQKRSVKYDVDFVGSRLFTPNSEFAQYYYDRIMDDANKIADSRKKKEVVGDGNSADEIITVNKAIDFRSFYKSIERVNNVMYQELLKLRPMDRLSYRDYVTQRARVERELAEQQEVVKKMNTLTKLKQEEYRASLKREKTQIARMNKLRKMLDKLSAKEDDRISKLSASKRKPQKEALAKLMSAKEHDSNLTLMTIDERNSALYQLQQREKEDLFNLKKVRQSEAELSKYDTQDLLLIKRFLEDADQHGKKTKKKSEKKLKTKGEGNGQN